MTRLNQLILLRLLASQRGLSQGDLKASLVPLMETPLSADAFNEIAASLVDQGLLEERPLRLTPAGQAVALDFLGRRKVPNGWTWRHVKKELLVARALGLAGSEGHDLTARRSRGSLPGRILKLSHGLPGAAVPTRTQAVDALVWRQFGVDTDKPLTLAGIRAQVLRAMLETESRLTVEQLTDLLAAKAVAAARPTGDALETAVLRRWVSEQDPTMTAPRADGDPGPMSDDQFANVVLSAARSEGVRRFGEKKAFIASVWDVLSRRRQLAVPLAQFKERLLEANRLGTLALSRADLVGAMDPSDVARSEANGNGATFHFINLH